MSSIDGYHFGVLTLKEKARHILRWFSEGKTVEQVVALCGDDARDRAVVDTYIVLFSELGLIKHVAPISKTFQVTEAGRCAIKMLGSQDAEPENLGSARSRNEGRTLA